MFELSKLSQFNGHPGRRFDELTLPGMIARRDRPEASVLWIALCMGLLLICPIG
jgi:hypothetical protein